MAVSYIPGQVLQEGDLDIRFSDSNGSPTNVYEITYDLYYVDPGPPETEVLIPPAGRTPVNSMVGVYYASMMVPPSASLGAYRIRWTFQQASGMATQQVVQEFQVAEPETQLVTMSAIEEDMVRQLRIFLRDHCVAAEEVVILNVDGELMEVRMDELWEALQGLEPPHDLGTAP